MFSWLSTQLPEYPETLNLKMYAHIQEPDCCPYFRLELADHPLSQEYDKGIIPERVKEIMLARLRHAESCEAPPSEPSHFQRHGPGHLHSGVYKPMRNGVALHAVRE